MINFLFTKTPLMFLVQSFWRDESFSYLLAKKNLFEILILTAKDFNPPLYYLLLHFWMTIFGSTEIALRSLSLIFYWATLYVAYLFMAEIMKLSGKKPALYLLLFLVNPFLIYYAFEARMYSLLAFLASLSFYALYKKNDRLYLVAAIAGLYTHYFMIFVIAAQLIFTKRLWKKAVWIAVAFLPWLVFVALQKGLNVNSFWIEKPSPSIFLQLVGIIYTGFENNSFAKDQPVTIISVFLLFIIAIGHKKTKLFWQLLLWAVGIPLFIAIISFYKPIFFPRYFIFSAVGLILLLVYVLEKLPVYARGLIIIFIVIVTFRYQQTDLIARKKDNVRKTITEIKTLAGKNDVIYVTNELDFFDAQYYFSEKRVFIYGKTYEEIPAYVGKVLMPKSKLVYSLPVYPQKAFILTSPDHYEIQATY